MKTVLVTGASGFAGSHFIKKYSDKYKILGTWNSTPISLSNALTIQLNLLDFNSVKSTLLNTKPDVILHLAGKAKTWNNNLDDLIQDNFQTARNLLDAVIDINKDETYKPKILIVTSAEVYGKTINPESISENNPFFPANEYGLSKIMVDRLAFLYSQSKNLNVIVLRTFNNSGPGQKPGFFISDMASQIVKIEKGEQQELAVGNLEAIRDLLDVRDVVDAYFKAIEEDLPSGEAYNICSGKGVSMKQLLDGLLKHTDKEINIVEDPKRMRPSDNPIAIGNNAKFCKATNWQPTIPLEQTLQDSLDYWRKI